MTKKEYKHIVKEALEYEYGFSPCLKDIQLMEANDTGTYIAFMIHGRYYRFDSYIVTIGGMRTVWAGDGTIERLSEHDRKFT